MGDAYQDPFEAFRKKKKKEQEPKKVEPQAEVDDPGVPDDKVRPKGFTTSRHTREDLIPAPPPPPPPEPEPVEDYIPGGDKQLTEDERPEGFVSHKFAEKKKKLSPDEIKKPKGFESHNME
ncbi:MAG: hypothetical protein E3J72_01720 [Planctomycetota bacterium]|nr:MAG: hypothetical protein E3J72_01720 [Planctomycetota bacterium]